MSGLPFIATWIQVQILEPFNILLQLLTSRLLFAALALFVLTLVIRRARKNAPPQLRSWLWALCIPMLFLPFEHSAVALLQRQSAPLIIIGQLNLTVIQVVLAYVWLAGFVLFCVKTMLQRKQVIRAIKRGQLDTCAAYSHRFRTRIYVPQNFYTAYSFWEKQMLLAHEHQHIRQHDPMVYRALQIVQCVFWFCPFVHKAANLVRQDRELLCDAKVMRKHPKKDYGLLLLREAEKEIPPQHAVARYAPEKGSIQERVRACVVPFRANKKAVGAVLGITVLLFAVGTVGLLKHNAQTQHNLRVTVGQEVIEGAQQFMRYEDNYLTVDEHGLYQYILEQGYKAGQTVSISATVGQRTSLTTCYTTAIGTKFALEELKTRQISVENNTIMAAIYNGV